MSIVFRNVKGTALTYTELDRNQAQFFYSASVAASTLKLHYTGSSILNSEGQTDYEPRFVEVPLGSGGSTLNLVEGSGIDIYNDSDGNTVIENIGNATPGEPLQSIQYNRDSSFDGDSSFLYNSRFGRVGIGVMNPSGIENIDRRLHLRGDSGQGAIIRLESFFDLASNNIARPDETAFLEIVSGGEVNRDNEENIFGKFGKVDQGEDPQLHINRYFIDGKTHFSFGDTHRISHTVTSTAIAINATDTKRNLAVVGAEGIGIGQNQGNLENRIRPLPNGVWDRSFVQIGVTGTPPLNVTRKGLAIHSPMNQDDGGNMIIAISDDRDGVLSNNQRHPNRLLVNSYADGSNMLLESSPSSHIASFLSNGTVGIGIPNPNTDIRLDINGNYRGKTANNTLSADDNNGISIELDFVNYSFITTTVDSTFTSQVLTFTAPTVPPVGTKGVVLIINNKTIKISISTTNVYSTNGNSLELETNKRAIVSFISDGSKLYITGAQLNLEI